MTSVNLLDQLELDLLNCSGDDLDSDNDVEDIVTQLGLSLTKNHGSPRSTSEAKPSHEPSRDHNGDKIDIEWKLLLSGTQHLMDLFVQDDVIQSLSSPESGLVTDDKLLSDPSDQQLRPNHQTDWTMFIPKHILDKDELAQGNIKECSEEEIRSELNSLMDSLIESVEYLFALSSTTSTMFTQQAQSKMSLKDTITTESNLDADFLEQTLQIRRIENDEDEFAMLSAMKVNKADEEIIDLTVNNSTIPTLEEAKTYKLQLQHKDNQDEANLKTDYDMTKAWMNDEMKEIKKRKERRNEEMKRAKRETMAVRIERVFRGWSCRRKIKSIIEQEKAIRLQRALVEEERARSVLESSQLEKEDKFSNHLRSYSNLLELERTNMKIEDITSLRLQEIPLFRLPKIVKSEDEKLSTLSIQIAQPSITLIGIDQIHDFQDVTILSTNRTITDVGVPDFCPPVANQNNTWFSSTFSHFNPREGSAVNAGDFNGDIHHNHQSELSAQRVEVEEDVEYFDACDYSSCSDYDDDCDDEISVIDCGHEVHDSKCVQPVMNQQSDKVSIKHSQQHHPNSLSSVQIEQPAWKFRRKDDSIAESQQQVVEETKRWSFQLPAEVLKIKNRVNKLWVKPSTVVFEEQSKIVPKNALVQSSLPSSMSDLMQKSLYASLWKSIQVMLDFTRVSDVYRYVPNPKEHEIKSLDLSVESLQDITFLTEPSYREINHLTLNVNKIHSLAAFSTGQNASIEYLSVSDNCLETSQGLESLPNLRYLNVDTNRLVDLQYMDSHKLMILSITCNQLKALPTFRASNLLKLDVFGNQIETLEMNQLKRFPNLVHLNVGKNKIQSIADDTFQENKLLQTLILSHNKLASLPRKMILPNLAVLWCNGNQLTALDSWIDGRTIVETSQNHGSQRGTNAAVSSSLFLPMLQKLYLQDNQITSIHPLSLVGLPLLKELDLSFNRLETVASLDGLWIARNLSSLKLNDNPIFKTVQESKFLSIKILMHFPKLSTGSLIGGGENAIDSGDAAGNIFDQMKSVYEARKEENKLFTRLESRGLCTISTFNKLKRKISSGKSSITASSCSSTCGTASSSFSSFDQRVKMQMEIFQLEQDINVLRNKKLFLKRPNSLEKCDQILTEARNHRSSFDIMRKMSQSLSTLSKRSNPPHVTSFSEYQLVSFQFTSHDQDLEKIRDIKVPFSSFHAVEKGSNPSASLSSATTKISHGGNQRPIQQSRQRGKEIVKKKIQLPTIDYDRHAIMIQKLIRGFLLRCRFKRIQSSIQYHDDELDELFALEGVDMSSFDLTADELLDDRYPAAKYSTAGVSGKISSISSGIGSKNSELDDQNDDPSAQPITFVYGDHRKRKFSARKADEVEVDSSTRSGAHSTSGGDDEVSRPGSSHSAVTINSAKTSARSDMDSSMIDDQSKRTPLKQNQAALIEEWGISDPKLMATFLKRNKKIQNHIKASAAKEQNAEARYQKFVKQAQASGRAAPPHAPHGKPRPNGRQVPPAWLSMDKQP